MTGRHDTLDEQITDRTPTKRKRGRERVTVRDKGSVVRVRRQEDDHDDGRPDRPSKRPGHGGACTLVPAHLALETADIAQLGLDFDNEQAPGCGIERQEVDPSPQPAVNDLALDRTHVSSALERAPSRGHTARMRRVTLLRTSDHGRQPQIDDQLAFESARDPIESVD